MFSIDPFELAKRAWLLAGVAVIVLTLSMGGCQPPVVNPGDVTLAGTWKGDVDYTASVTVGSSAGNSYTFTRSFTVTFTADGQPDAVDLALDGDRLFRIPATGLLNVGDSLDESVDTTNPGTGAVTTNAIHATVTSITRTTTSFEIKLELNLTFTGDNTGTLLGTYSLQASVQPDGKLAWTGLTNLTVGDASLGVTAQVTGVGSLLRQ